ncbi:MAG: S41 family peptidase [Anaerolineales bacterium]
MDFTMLDSKRRLLVLLLYSILLVLPSVIVGYQIHALWPPSNEHYALVKEAQNLIDEYFLGELPEQMELERGMIKGMIAEIGDPYTIYLEPAASEIQSDTLSGEYGGIGAHLSRDENGRYRLFPFEGSPAATAGVVDGDILIAVDGEPVLSEMDQDEVLSMIRGPVGMEVIITLASRNAEGTEIILSIERQTFAIPSVSSYFLEQETHIAVIEISLFSEQTPREIEQTYDDLLKNGVKAVIVDLRNNPGGILDSGVAVAEFFLPEGTILYEQKKGEERIQYDVENPGEGQNIPLVVLVNDATASSAEVVAAALQANGRAPLIGRPTFGKGVVQSVLVLRDGSSLYITSARWMTPDLERFDQQGLQPDIPISTDNGDNEPFLQAAIQYLKETSPGGL